MKKKKHQKKTSVRNEKQDEKQVLLGVRVSEQERQRIKMYAVQHGTTVASLIREYINGLVENDQKSNKA